MDVERSEPPGNIPLHSGILVYYRQSCHHIVHIVHHQPQLIFVILKEKHSRQFCGEFMGDGEIYGDGEATQPNLIIVQ